MCAVSSLCAMHSSSCYAQHIVDGEGAPTTRVNPGQYLFTGTDEWGKTVYFFKMHITGLQDRLFGPFDNRTMAVENFDVVLAGALQSFCEMAFQGNNGMEHVALPTNLTPVPARKDGDS